MSPPVLAPDTIFASDYRILRVLAESGAGTVYVAEQISTGISRALKLFHPPITLEPPDRARFLTEANRGTTLKHPGYVEVIAAGIEGEGEGEGEGETPWMAMELLMGEDLETRLARGEPMEAGAVLDVLDAIDDALRSAGASGVFHGALRPSNVFLLTPPIPDAKPPVRVLGLGVAGLAAAWDARAPDLAAVGRERFYWMAPEQFEKPTNARIDARTDVWALGLLAFRMLTGRYYWRAAREPAATTMLLSELLVGELSPAGERARELGVVLPLPEYFDEWFALCVNRDPGERFPDTATAREQFAGLLGVEREGHGEGSELVGNPKGSLYDDGLFAELTPDQEPAAPDSEGGPDGPYRKRVHPPRRARKPELKRVVTPKRPEGYLIANPKGSLYDRGLSPTRPRPIGRIVLVVVAAVIAAAVLYFRLFRR
ncbi:MAG: protein kinase [Minicystis sp.]